MPTELASLKRRVLETIKASRSESDVEDVHVEPDRDEDGIEFLRVTVQVKQGHDPSDSDLVALLEAIEAAIVEVDERLPSVRFSDAA